MVVTLIAVDVVHLWQVVRVRYERQRNLTMHLAALRLMVNMDHERTIVVVLLGLWHDAHLATLQTSHTSEAANFVLSVDIADGSPLFLVCLSIHRCSAICLRSFTFSFLFFPISLWVFTWHGMHNA